MRIIYRCTSLKISSREENAILQALQFRNVGAYRKFLGRAGVSHYGLNEVLWGFNVN
jgi:hypothetical protein